MTERSSGAEFQEVNQEQVYTLKHLKNYSNY